MPCRPSLVALLLVPAAAFAQGQDSDEEPANLGEELLAIVTEPWTGGRDGIRDRRRPRMLTTDNVPIEAGQGQGLDYEAMMWPQDDVNARNAPGGPANLRVLFVPPFGELIPALLDRFIEETVRTDRATALTIVRRCFESARSPPAMPGRTGSAGCGRRRRSRGSIRTGGSAMSSARCSGRSARSRCAASPTSSPATSPVRMRSTFPVTRPRSGRT